MGGLFVTAFGVAVGRGREMAGALTAVAAIPGHSGDEHVGVRAVLALCGGHPSGTSPRAESSVLAAAFIGWRYLDEGSVRRRTIARRSSWAAS